MVGMSIGGDISLGERLLEGGKYGHPWVTESTELRPVVKAD